MRPTTDKHFVKDALGQITQEYSGVPLPDNFIYISHLGSISPDDDFRYWYLPVYPDSITDSMESSFQAETALGRSAPIFSYSHSGPRSVTIDLKLHREMMDDVNIKNKSITKRLGEDYIDNLIKALQSITVPNYDDRTMSVEPPMVAVKLGNEIFVKGVVSGSIGVTYEKPILYNNKYAQVSLTLNITEVDPYSARDVMKMGSFRGYVSTLDPKRLSS